MTTAMKTHHRPKRGKIDKLAEIPGFGLMTTSMATATQAYVDVIGKCQSEICDFMTQRLSNDLAHGQNLAKCKDLTEAASVQQEWLRKTAEDYMAESQKLMQLGMRAATAGVNEG